MKSVAIYGSYGKGNLGDDALLASVMSGLKGLVPNEGLCIRTASLNSYITEWFPGVSLFKEGVLQNVDAELLVLGGGTQFFSFPVTGMTSYQRFRHIIRSVRDRFMHRTNKGRFLSIRYNHAIALSIGLGPFLDSRRMEMVAAKWLRGFDWVSVRDPEAMAFCDEHGISEVVQYPDLCFSTQLWAPDLDPQEFMLPRASDHVVVIVRDWPYATEGWGYLSPLSEAVGRIRAEGFSVRYVSFSPSRDLESIRALARKGEEVEGWKPSKESMASFVRRTFAQTDVVISSRAHGLIFSAALGIPSVGIIIEPKLRLVSSQLGSGSTAWSAPFCPSKLLASVKHLGSERRRARRATEEAARSLRDGANRCIRTFSERVRLVLSNGSI